uniref:Reverse transcriptase domain-containing protein n=1 Tax=Tanacetum cinerariifolium TaxID=118510 RepID=A0A6L2L9Y6_TANCI|nr:hypothetical protein [Tanacetum cinerariifolium]
MEEMLAKFIDEGKCEYDEMEIFIKEFRTTNELLLKEQNYLLSELKIKVDKFVLPIDFVILDMPEEFRISIILGRPFMATARAMIDVFNKKIMLRVGDDEVIFDMDQSMKMTSTEDDVTRCIESVDMAYSEEQQNDGSDNIMSEHLFSESASVIDKKKHVLKSLPSHLEYAYLNGDESFPVIILSKLYEREKNSLLQDAKPRLIRWVLLLQGFNIEIKDKKRVDYLATDHLSRLENPYMEVLTEREMADEFPDEHLTLLKSKFNDDEPWLFDLESPKDMVFILGEWLERI